ncbi:hypothetical protein K2Q08_02320 [Patescibacteria group bacterium]|nr:hypothetical protein [Patescibacteria group bacterium]
MREHSFFSPNLIQETINVFREEDGILLSEEEAISYLHSFADLYLAFAGEGRAAARRQAGAADLIDPHNC